MYQDPIIVVGLPRSGTSVTAGVVHRCGAWGGDMAEANEYNAHGYFENIFLAALLAGILKDSTTENKPSVVPLAMDYAGIKPHDPWFIKHPSILFNNREKKSYVDGFSALFPNAKWVVVRRPEADVRESQNFMWDNNPPERIGDYKEERLEQMRLLLDGPQDTFEIWPFEEMHKPGLDGFRDMVDWAGLEWDEPAVRALIDPDLHHFRANGPGAPFYDPE